MPVKEPYGQIVFVFSQQQSQGENILAKVTQQFEQKKFCTIQTGAMLTYF